MLKFYFSKTSSKSKLLFFFGSHYVNCILSTLTLLYATLFLEKITFKPEIIRSISFPREIFNSNVVQIFIARLCLFDGEMQIFVKTSLFYTSDYFLYTVYVSTDLSVCEDVKGNLIPPSFAFSPLFTMAIVYKRTRCCC